MSGKRLLQSQKAEVNQRAGNARGTGEQSAAQGARRQRPGYLHPLQGRNFFPDGEIRDPLGNFSEQVGAYFG